MRCFMIIMRFFSCSYEFASFFLVDRVKNAFVGWRMNCRYEQCVNLLSNVKYCVLERGSIHYARIYLMGFDCLTRKNASLSFLSCINAIP